MRGQKRHFLIPKACADDDIPQTPRYRNLTSPSYLDEKDEELFG
jgi:hypothetical protein